MKSNQIKDFYQKYEPYSNRDYTQDAKELIFNRIEHGRYDHYQLIPSKNNKSGILDAKHAAQWSKLSRKRKCGLMLSTLYAIAARYELDMTATLAHRLLEGLYGCGVSKALLNEVFGESGRKASEKSPDWERLDQIIKENRKWAIHKIEQHKERIKTNKETAYLLVTEIYKKNPR